MGILQDTMLNEKNRPDVIQDCVALVDAEVASKKGITGMVIKTGYKGFKAIKPSIVPTAVDVLLDDFAKVLDSYYDEYLASVPDKSKSFDEWAKARDTKMADDLLGVTDDIMERSDKKAIKKIYNGMRNIAQKNVAQAIPAVGRLVVKYLG
jgi:hypothetical protein